MNLSIFIFAAPLLCTTFVEKTKKKLACCYEKTREYGCHLYNNAAQVADAKIRCLKEHASNLKDRVASFNVTDSVSKMSEFLTILKNSVLRKMEKVGLKQEDEDARIRRQIMELLEKFKTVSDDEALESEDLEKEVGHKDKKEQSESAAVKDGHAQAEQENIEKHDL